MSPKIFLLHQKYKKRFQLISKWLEDLEKDNLKNPTDRHSDFIDKLAEWIYKNHSNDAVSYLNFICTHNSRRSQFTQTMSEIVQAWMGINYADDTDEELAAYDHTCKIIASDMIRLFRKVQYLDK